MKTMSASRAAMLIAAFALVSGCALIGGDAMLDAAWTAIAVSP